MYRYFYACIISLVSATPLFAQELPSAMVPLGDAAIYVTGDGNNAKKLPPIIFVHAGFQDHTMWDGQAREFMKDRFVLMVDLPGHGRTKDGSEAPIAASVIKVVMDSLYIKTAVLVGLSFGGAVVTDFALTYPDRVDRLVLAAPGLSGWQEGRKPDSITAKFFTEFGSALTNKDTATAAEVFTHYWFDGMRTKDKVSPLLRDLIYTTTKNTMRQHKTEGWPKLNSSGAINRLTELKKPTLILTGTLDLPEILLVNGYIANNIPNAKQVMISGAGHMINLEKPERFNSELKKFLTQ